MKCTVNQAGSSGLTSQAQRRGSIPIAGSSPFMPIAGPGGTASIHVGRADAEWRAGEIERAAALEFCCAVGAHAEFCAALGGEDYSRVAVVEHLAAFEIDGGDDRRFYAVGVGDFDVDRVEQAGVAQAAD
jgi:hypothetical protein